MVYVDKDIFRTKPTSASIPLSLQVTVLFLRDFLDLGKGAFFVVQKCAMVLPG